jgi:RNA polymerase sigma-70 factor (ECF subfamily)
VTNATDVLVITKYQAECDFPTASESLRFVERRSDATLVAAVLAGDTDLFGALIRRHRDAYTRFAVRMLGSVSDADDALQGAFIRAFRALRTCQQPEFFRTWLYRIVINECRTFAAKRHRRERRLVRDEDALAHAVAADRGEAGAIEEDIQRALLQLAPEQRQAFLLKFVEEMSYEEMAAVTGAGISALKMRVKRACERLRELLEGVVHHG